MEFALQLRTNKIVVLSAVVVGIWQFAGPLPVCATEVETWGRNNLDQLGFSSGVALFSSKPVLILNLPIGVTTVAQGPAYSIALANGSLEVWGNGNPIPSVSTGLSNGVTSAALGAASLYLQNGNLAIQNGSGISWGGIQSGPVVVSGLSNGVTAIAQGDCNLAVQNGTAVSWGDNYYGELGNGTSGNTTFALTPGPVTGLTSGVTAVSSGGSHSLALQNGGVYAWGLGTSGQLGDGQSRFYMSTTPVAATGLTAGVTAIAAGYMHSLAIQDGKVYAWGYNGDGELGIGNYNNSSLPVEVDPTDLANIVSVAANEDSSYALSSDGSLWVWGGNGYGDLGLGTSVTHATPQHLLPPSGSVFTSIESDSEDYSVITTLAATATPEPTSLPLLIMSSVALLRRRKRISWSANRGIRLKGNGANFLKTCT